MTEPWTSQYHTVLKWTEKVPVCVSLGVGAHNEREFIEGASGGAGGSRVPGQGSAAPGQGSGDKEPEAENFLTVERPQEAANLPPLLYKINKVTQ